VIHLTVDGRALRVHPGTRLLEAVRAAGADVPVLCEREGLPAEGSCRLCSVEVAGAPHPVPACHTACAEGMAVTTTNESLNAARRGVVRMLLADHPVPCRAPGDARGPCELEALAGDLGIAPAPTEVAESDGIDRSHPAIAVRLAACVECGRCIRACADLQGHHVIAWHDLGTARRLAFSGGAELGPSACVGCGQCVAECPTGALSPAADLSRPADAAVDTVCPYCGVGCGITAHTREGQVRQVTSSPDHPANRGRLCVKGRFGLDFETSGDRLTAPLVRRDGVPGPCGPHGFREADWDEALDLVAERMLDIAARHGGPAVGGLGSAKCTNEDNYLFQKWMRAGLGSHNVDHCARLCHSPSVVALKAMLGSGAATNPNTDFLQADAVFLIGTNTLETHPVIATFVREGHVHGGRLIVADPRRVGLAREADLHLQQRPGSDAWLVHGIAREVLEAGLADEGFIATHTEGFEAYRDGLLALDMDEVTRVTGVPRAALREAARIYGEARRALIGWGMGITQHVAGTLNCAALGGLALLTGNLGRPGAGLNPLRGQSNVQGASDMGVLPNVFPGYQAVSDASLRARFAAAWGREIPETPGLTVVEMMRAAREGTLRGLHVMGENPALSDPDLAHVREALGSLEFLAVQDVFFTETCAYADVILPAASVLERAGSVTNTERRIQATRPVLPPPGRARADGEILADLMARAGMPGQDPDPAPVMAEMAALTPTHAGVSAERLGADGLVWPCPTPDHPGTPILHQGGAMRGKAAFLPPRLVPPAETAGGDFPHLLTTGRTLDHYQTGTLSRRSRVLDALSPEPWAEVHPDTLREVGAADGGWLSLESPRGRIRVRARASEGCLPGCVFVPFHFAEAAVNVLVHDTLDPEAKIPEYKCSAVRIRPG
jgi:formate dehydrogenase alpha subunit